MDLQTEKRNPERGSVLLFAAIGLMALGAIFYSYASWVTSVKKGQKSLETKALVRVTMDQISNALENDQSFFNTATNNAPLNCFVNGGACPSGPVGAINVYLAGTGGSLLMVSSNPNSGFDQDGKPCNSFDSVDGNDICPFHFDVTAEIDCSAGCTANVSAGQKVSVTPTLRMSIKLKFKPRTPSAFTSLNEDKIYSVTFDRGKNKLVTQNYCSAIGGVYNASSRFCTLNMQGECPPDSYMTGLDGNGGRVCVQRAKYSDVACAPGSAFVGTFSTGKLTCGKY